MREITGGSHRRFEQDRARIENIIRQAKALRAKYLEGNFWPIFGTTGGVLLFLAAVVIVPGVTTRQPARSASFFTVSPVRMTRSQRAAATRFAPAGAANNRDGSIGNAKHFPPAGRIALIAIRSFTKDALHECRERGFSRPRSHVWHGTKGIAQVNSFTLHGGAEGITPSRSATRHYNLCASFG